MLGAGCLDLLGRMTGCVLSNIVFGLWFCRCEPCCRCKPCARWGARGQHKIKIACKMIHVSEEAMADLRSIVGWEEGSEPPRITVRPLHIVIGRAGVQLGIPESDQDAWEGALQAALVEVGVLSLRGFLRNAVRLNKMFRGRGLPELPEATIMMMSDKICDMIMGPQTSEEVAEEEMVVEVEE